MSDVELMFSTRIPTLNLQIGKRQQTRLRHPRSHELRLNFSKIRAIVFCGLEGFLQYHKHEDQEKQLKV